MGGVALAHQVEWLLWDSSTWEWKRAYLKLGGADALQFHVPPALCEPGI